MDKLNDYQLEKAWKGLADIPVDYDDDNPDGYYKKGFDLPCGIHFEAGTDKEDVWRYFDENHSKGVSYLLYEFDTDDERPSVCITPLSVKDEGFAYTLNQPDANGEFTAEFIPEGKEPLGFDSVIAAQRYIRANNLHEYTSGPVVDKYKLNDLKAMGTALHFEVSKKLDELKDFSLPVSEASLKKLYAQTLSDFAIFFEINKTAIFDQMKEEETPSSRITGSIEAYAETVFKNISDYIQDTMEKTFPSVYAVAYIFHLSNESTYHSKITTCKDRAIMEISSLTPEEATTLINQNRMADLENSMSEKTEVHYDKIHEEIPLEFFNKLYDVQNMIPGKYYDYIKNPSLNTEDKNKTNIDFEH